MRFALHVQVGGSRVKRWGVWLPDGLSIWLNSRGVHLFWSKSPYMPRMTFDRLDAE